MGEETSTRCQMIARSAAVPIVKNPRAAPLLLWRKPVFGQLSQVLPQGPPVQLLASIQGFNLASKLLVSRQLKYQQLCGNPDKIEKLKNLISSPLNSIAPAPNRELPGKQSAHVNSVSAVQREVSVEPLPPRKDP